jgi:hypothetical protein
LVPRVGRTVATESSDAAASRRLRHHDSGVVPPAGATPSCLAAPNHVCVQPTFGRMPNRRPLSMAPAVATHFRHCDVLTLNSSAAQVLPNGSARPGVDHARVGLLVGLLLGDQLLFVRHGVISAPPNSRREPQNASTRASHTHTDDDWLAKLNIAIPPSPRWALGGYASFVTLPVANQLRHEGRLTSSGHIKLRRMVQSPQPSQLNHM